jgi:hypothetical protein
MKRYIKSETEYSVNIETVLKQFKKEYNFLYDNYDRVAGYSEAVDEFNDRMRKSDNFKNFVGEFSNYREDFLGSDREVAAFMFAMESMGLL